MVGLRIALLDASHNHPATRRNFRRELDANLVEFDVTNGAFPPDASFDGIVVTGSRSSVYWDEAWIDKTRAYVADAAAAGVPMLGVCWGHQLLADALGGTVESMGEYEIGYRTIDHTGTSALFDGIDERFVAFTTHSDAVTALPPDMDIIAENDMAIQGFEGDRIWGIQFHPEYDMATARDVTEAKDDLHPDRKAAALDGITDENYRSAGQAKTVFDNFLRIISDA